MRSRDRLQGRVTVTPLEIRRRFGFVASGGSSNSYPFYKQPFDLVPGDWTADGSLYYADVLHNLNGTVYSIDITDNHTGLDVFPERINRTLDKNKCRIWLAYIPQSLRVIII